MLSADARRSDPCWFGSGPECPLAAKVPRTSSRSESCRCSIRLGFPALHFPAASIKVRRAEGKLPMKALTPITRRLLEASHAIGDAEADDPLFLHSVMAQTYFPTRRPPPELRH